jgi:hypothetical protein
LGVKITIFRKVSLEKYREKFQKRQKPHPKTPVSKKGGKEKDDGVRWGYYFTS